MAPAIGSGDTAAAEKRSRAAAAIALAAFLIGSGAAVAVVLSGTPGRPRGGAAGAAPLELIALSHERRGTALDVRGIVRNPAAGARLDALSVMVYLVDPDGQIRTSTRAPIDAVDLAPGQASAFAVVVPDAGAASRYRVSFRTAAGDVEHVDRRAGAREGQ